MDLENYCQSLAKAATEAGAWVERNTEIVGNEREGLRKELRRAGRLFRSCARAASRKMCAGVFGPSQAGKSYLISALARGESNEMIALFDREQHDFISEINPEGGKESTGLVTRFTLSPQGRPPAGHPVQARLLSEMDLVKILANAYFGDCEHKEESKSDITGTLARLKALPAKEGAGASLDDLEELREYISRNFRAKARAKELERLYWEEALELGQRLDLEGRVRLYGLIWDETSQFTSLLRKLLQTLESLGHPERLYCAMDALIPRARSIIDVATLASLDDDSAAADLSVATDKGGSAKLPRAIVAALTAELDIFMRDKPADYFEHTDLLDFPGYRSRYKLEDLRAELEKKPEMLRDLFLRGKVAYLFERYCAERELNSMLLCIGPSNQEVQDLPGVINAWVSSTHGQNPEDREKSRVSLLFVLTKMDMEFEDKKGAPSLESRWDNRLKASLLDFFGKQYDWPEHWTPDRGFDNIFLLRNPNFRFDAIMEYKDDVETGIRPERLDYVAQLRNAFLGSPLVAEHFRDPERAWKEAMRFNDGGISYIRESLNPLCDPAIKSNQLLLNVNSCREGLARRLKKFHEIDDKEELRKQKMLLIKSLFQSLGALEEKHQRLGQLLRGFTISDADIYDMLPEASRRYQDLSEAEAGAAEEEEEQSSGVDLESIDLGALNPFAREAPEKPENREAEPKRDEAAFFAEYVEGKWVERLRKFSEDEAERKYFALKPREFEGLAGELATGAARLGLKEEMAKGFRQAAAYSNIRKENIARKQAALAARTLNRFVDWLGHDPRNGDPGTVALPGGKPVQVFAPAQNFQGEPKLAETASPYTRRWFGDWLNALAGLTLDNVDFDGQKVFNAAENAALGALIATFEGDGGQNAGEMA